MLRFALLVFAGLALSLSAVDTTPAADPTPAENAKPAEAKADALAGMKFAITLVSSDGQEKSEDVLIFEGDTLSSQGYADSRFNPGKVTIKGKGETTAFEAIMISPRGAEATWSGKVSGDSVQGKVLTGVRGRIDVSTFTGTLQR